MMPCPWGCEEECGLCMCPPDPGLVIGAAAVTIITIAAGLCVVVAAVLS